MSAGAAESSVAKSKKALPSRVDYLVIGAGATGMAFCDTLLHHANVSIVLIDQHNRPGGQWLDSYEFVKLHQPSSMYGVESVALEPKDAKGGDAHRATRVEILDYFERVCRMLEEKFEFYFEGNSSFDMEQLDELPGEDEDDCKFMLSEGRSILARKIVDARYLQPDLPVHVPPKFRFNSSVIKCFPVNSLAAAKHEKSEHYVVIGAGKTGMDAISFLLHQEVDPDDIVWIVPNEAWITAREKIGSCMEFLYECTRLLKEEHLDSKSMKQVLTSTEFFQRGFVEWEKKGKAYRFQKDVLPTKFKDATLCSSELEFIAQVTRVVRKGRVLSIDDSGSIHFNDGTFMQLPWSSGPVHTTFVHCSAGAFNYSKQLKKPPPVFHHHLITIQDVYGTPGFCFVGSIIGRLESLGLRVTDAEKNYMCFVPMPDAAQAMLPLGPSGGDIGVISSSHGYVQRLSNLRKWLKLPEVRDWLVGHRLFNLGHWPADQTERVLEEIWTVLQECEVVE